LKLINDVHGHDVGDEVLAARARRLKACLRGTDDVLGSLPVDMDEWNGVSRLGGYEFTVLLSKVDGAEGVCERIVGTLAEPLTIGDVSVTVRASLGVALLLEHAMNEEDLLCLADRALYEEKRSGACGYRFA
jgi:diguanylate cyclase (GGDEF)-like protein